MSTKLRKTFQAILSEESGRIASRLETKARQASWLAKIQPASSGELYSIKHAALRQLFKVPAYEPLIRDAWTTNRGFLISVRLRKTDSLLHVPFGELNAKTQQKHGVWISRRARGRWWRQMPRIQCPASQTAADAESRSTR
jgi:hypothetical protein